LEGQTKYRKRKNGGTQRAMKFNKTTVSFSDGTSFVIYHNIATAGNINSIDAAIQCWEARTDQFTAKSLCDYINSKRLKGYTDHYAFTPEEFAKLPKPSRV